MVEGCNGREKRRGLARLGGFGAAGSGQRAAGSANGAQHDSLGFEPQENVTTHPRERQRRVPSGAIWMEMTGVGNIGAHW